MTTIKGADPTGKRLFFQLLHRARWLELFNWSWRDSKNYLFGMRKVMLDNREDFTIADDMRSVWKSQNSGAE